MEVLFLGTGNAFASGGRNPMAILVREGGFGALLDCGPASLVALKKEGLDPGVVDAILLSHHHGDHFAGVPFLVLHERYVSRRTKPLTVVGPADTAVKLQTTTRLFFPGIEPLPFELAYRDLAPGEEIALGPLDASPFEVDHYSGGTALGYRITLGGKTLVFSGDTAWTEALVAPVEGADLFVCECSSFEEPLERHMSYRDLERNRDRLKARRTLLVHPGEDVLAKGEELAYELAHDGMRLTL